MSAKKDNRVNDALSFIMGTKPEGSLTEQKQGDGSIEAIVEPHNSHDMAIKKVTSSTKRRKRERLENHHVGFYPSDWQALERMAAAEGGNVAVLIRRAVRDMLSRSGY